MTDRLRRPRRAAGFTLMELLVVIAIIIIVSAVTLPTVLPALNNRQVSEGARILQAALVGARDSAIHAGAPRGIRLLPDPVLSDPISVIGGRLVANRIIPIQPAADITEGFAMVPSTNPQLPPASLGMAWTNPTTGALFTSTYPLGVPPRYPIPLTLSPPTYTSYPAYHPPTQLVSGSTTLPAVNVLMVVSSTFRNNNPADGPNPPTDWFYNVRIGDRFRFHDSGRYYTVVGPMTIANAENFVNDGLPTVSSLQVVYPSTTITPEYLFLVNGIDDDNDGYIDNGFNGVDENLNGLADDMVFSTAPANPINPEWTEAEAWQGNQVAQAALALPPAMPYTITRRPVPSPGARELALPGSCVIDLTTWNTTEERSRLPVDSNTGTVDILLNPSGQVVPTTTYSSPAGTTMGASFYHFWIADRIDVYSAVTTNNPQLPLPQAATGAKTTQYIQKDRRLLTLFSRTGEIVTNSIENFDFANAYTTSYNPNLPYSDAQLGIREAK